MPLLEITQTRQITAMLRLDERTAELVNQYGAFIHCEDADTVIENALNYVFAKDRDFQEFLKTAEAQNAPAILRVRKAPQAASSKAAVAGNATSALPKVAPAEARR